MVAVVAVVCVCAYVCVCVCTCVYVYVSGWFVLKNSHVCACVCARVQLDDGTGRILGGSSMDYNIEAGPAKYVVGTEQGVVLSVNLRKKKSNDCVSATDMGPGKHHGPIYAIHVRCCCCCFLSVVVLL